MGLIPGISGQKTEMADGAKINALSEYTLGNGVQIQGRTSGIAISSGLVGEKIEALSITTLSQASPTLNTYYDMTGASLPLTIGIWMIYWTSNIDLFQVTTVTAAQPILGVLALRDGSTVTATAALNCNPSAITLGRLGGYVFGNYLSVLTASKTYKLSAAFQAWSGTGQTCQTLSVDGPTAKFFAVRIA